MLQTPDNPGGLPVGCSTRSGPDPADRSQPYKDLADGPFFGGTASQGVRDAFWLQSMAAGHRNAYECIAAFSATDFRPDLAAIDVPTLVIHGDADQIVPFEVGGMGSSALIKDARLVSTPAHHTASPTPTGSAGNDLLAFITPERGVP